MQFRMIAAATLALCMATASQAQEAADHSAMGHGTAGEPAKLPAACLAAAGEQADMPTMSDESASADMNPVQKANAEAMAVMHGPMMTAAAIPDADLSFNCGMIAHHQGAIAMARVELAMGKDATSKALAEAIIEAQEKEIADMTAWVEKNGS